MDLKAIAELHVFFDSLLDRLEPKGSPKTNWTVEELHRRRDQEGPKGLFEGTVRTSGKKWLSPKYIIQCRERAKEFVEESKN